MKWTEKPDKYYKMIRESRHLQLVIYSEMLKEADRCRVDFVAYYALAASRLITATGFVGDNIMKIDGAEDERVIFQRILNSVKYRRTQFKNGIIEEGEGMSLDDLDYHLASDEENLIPLETADKKTKKTNRYSAYNIFKGEVNGI